MEPDIKFEFEGQSYTVAYKAYDLGRILLPDGRMLVVDAWLETYPPQPQGLHATHHVFTDKEPEEIAQLMKCAIAEVATQ